MATADQKSERVDKFAQTLRDLRERDDSYPPTVARLRQLADSEASDEDLFKTLKHESFVVGAKKDLSAPVALTEDVPRLTSGDVLLTYALGKLASADKPLHPVAKIVAKVEKTLQPAFETALNDRLAAGNLPATVGRLDVKDTPNLYLTQFPPPPPKTSPARELAKEMLAALRARREQGEETMALSDLFHSETERALVKKALADESFASAVLVVPVSNTLTLVAPADARENLLQSERLLISLLESKTTPKKPFATPNDLVDTLPEEHRPAFTQSLQSRLQSNTLPTGVLKRHEDGQDVLCLERHLSPATLLGEKVLAGLQRRRSAGQDYPVSLKKLLATDAPGTSLEVVERLVSDKSFKGKVILGVLGSADAPAALPGDEERLATSSLLLSHAVGLVSTPEQPLHPVKKVVSKVDAALRPAFEQAVTKHLAENTLPATLAAHDLKGQIHLRRADYPLPPPADEALANRLLTAMKNSTREGTYPVSVRELLAKMTPEAPEKVVKAALLHNAFRAHVVVSLPGDLDSLAALTEDSKRLAADLRLLEYALSRVRTDDNQAMAIADVCKCLAQDLRPEFTVAIGQHLAAVSLPATIGCLVIKKKPHLFLKTDLEPRPIILSSPVEEAKSEVVPMRESFDAEMTRLEEGRETREPEPESPTEQGELFVKADS